MIRRRETIQDRRRRRAEVDDPELVLAAAARFLEARPRSVGEVRRRLTEAGYRADLVEAAIGRLTDLGMLDDAAFARAWVESRDRARPRGEAALRRELALKGVARDVIEGALDGRRRGERGWRLGEAIPDEPAEARRGGTPSVDEEAAYRLLERRAAALRREPDPRVRRQKAYALLARNGFDAATCSTVAAGWVGRVEEGSADAPADVPD